MPFFFIILLTVLGTLVIGVGGTVAVFFGIGWFLSRKLTIVTFDDGNLLNEEKVDWDQSEDRVEGKSGTYKLVPEYIMYKKKHWYSSRNEPCAVFYKGDPNQVPPYRLREAKYSAAQLKSWLDGHVEREMVIAQATAAPAFEALMQTIKNGIFFILGGVGLAVLIGVIGVFFSFQLNGKVTDLTLQVQELTEQLQEAGVITSSEEEEKEEETKDLNDNSGDIKQETPTPTSIPRPTGTPLPTATPPPDEQVGLP